MLLMRVRLLLCSWVLLMCHYCRLERGTINAVAICCLRELVRCFFFHGDRGGDRDSTTNRQRFCCSRVYGQEKIRERNEIRLTEGNQISDCFTKISHHVMERGWKSGDSTGTSVKRLKSIRSGQIATG
jgi:hypothetical protein